MYRVRSFVNKIISADSLFALENTLLVIFKVFTSVSKKLNPYYIVYKSCKLHYCIFLALLNFQINHQQLQNLLRLSDDHVTGRDAILSMFSSCETDETTSLPNYMII